MPSQWVVHCKRSKYDVYIGRPSIWGNPYSIGRDGTREQVIAKYEANLSPELKERAKKELKGKILGCWCAPLACHGDVLARIANEPILKKGKTPFFELPLDSMKEVSDGK
jgi:hypothetical protein